MKFDKSKILFFLGLGIPALFVFKALFLSGPAVWGDAPYFYPEGLSELVNKPFAWTSLRNNFGQINSFIWISPLMILYGLLHNLFGSGNDAIIRILFYFPSLVLSMAGPIVLTRRLGYPKIVQFFASFVYTFNTYYLLLVDGGQVGIALAYGVFPLALYSLLELFYTPTNKRAVISLIILFLLIIIDPRLALVAGFATLAWVLADRILNKRVDLANLKYLFLLFVAVVGLSSYWLIPFFGSGGKSLSLDVLNLQFLSFLNAFTLFQPHWPANIFGEVGPPPFFFIGVPVLIFGSLLRSPRKNSLFFSLLFLIFAFLLKGSTPPLGTIYSWFVTSFPAGSAFRDSSKFFVPLILFGGILIGQTVDKLIKVRGMGKYITLGLIYSYFLFLVFPAILGNLNGVLKAREIPNDFNIIYEKIRDEEGSFRSLWFPERSPFSFQTESRPALDARNLVEKRPFAAANVGTYDRFNFMNNDNFLEWFDLLGIRYLVFSGNPRKEALNEEEQKVWDELLTLVEKNSGLERMEWGTEFPVYKVPEIKPRIFAVDKLTGVIGPEPLMVNPASVFFEDGKFDPRSLLELDPESVVLVFNGREKSDLVMSFLQEYFVDMDQAKVSEWATYFASNYLEWKYQLLIRGVETQDFDFGKGIAFSSVPGEKIELKIRTETSGRYLIAVRGLSGEPDKPLKLSINGEEYLSQFKKTDFGWFSAPVELDKGKHNLVLENIGGIQVVNVAALIPESDWKEAEILATQLIDRFNSVDVQEIKTIGQSLKDIDFEKINPTRYKVKGKGNWLIFSDSYHPLWKLRVGDKVVDSLPFYSMVNGFHIGGFKGESELVFEGQKHVRLGLYFSGTVAFLIIVFRRRYPTKK